jgi:hypothetical protein
MIAKATAKIDNGQDESTSPLPMWLIIVLIVVGASVVVGGGVAALLLIKKKRKSSTTPPGGPAPEAKPTADVIKAPEQVTVEMKPEPDQTGPAAGPADEEPHFCGECGHKVPEDAAFCPGCAKPISR